MQKSLKTRVSAPARTQALRVTPVRSGMNGAPTTEVSREPLTLLQQSIGNRGIQNLIKSEGGRDLVQPAPYTGMRTLRTTFDGELLQRFGYQEHQLAGDAATGSQKVVLFEGDSKKGIPRYEISFGEMVALAGDFFGSLEEMQKLAGDPSGLGQRKLDYARSKGGTVPEPSDQELTKKQKKEMDELYYKLNGANYMHFSEPKVNENNLRFYVKNHQKIVKDLFDAGQQKQDKDAALKDAMLKESFNAHFLTDAFCGGHITAPREGADEHWKKIYPLFLDNFFHHFSEKVAEYLNNQSGYEILTISYLKDKAMEALKEKAPPGIESYSLGGLISLAIHDYYNAVGLDVSSKVDASGNAVPGGYKWKAYGEAETRTLDQTIAASQKEMVIAAVKAGIADLEAAYDCTTLEELKQKVGPPFKVEDFVPEADTSSTRNVNFQWNFNSVDDLMQNTQMWSAIKYLLGPAGQVGKMLVGVWNDEKSQVKKNAIGSWIKRLWSETGTVLKEIAEYVPGGGKDHFSTDTMSRDYVAAMKADPKNKDKLAGATTGQMIGLIKRMLNGATGDDDERAILDILRAANKKGNIWEVMNGVGHFWGLEPDFQGEEWYTLLAVLSERYFPEFSLETKYNYVKWLVDNTSREWGEEACIAILNCATPPQFIEIVTKIGKKKLDSFLDGAEQKRFDELLKIHGYKG
ncbi:MAG TPA: hypothetical protein VHY08_06045 [Bacillota bacterium]|nr:hypothetical protein [Bacillota bacterium]